MKPFSKALKILAAIGLVLSAAASAEALMFSTSGIWSSQMGGIPISGLNTNTLSWGIGPPESSYVFDGVVAGTIPDGALNTTFNLGTFAHHNFPIGGAAITDATLDLTLNLDGGTASQTFSLDFEHNETSNLPPCNPVGVTFCPDVVSLPTLTLTETISLRGRDFNLEILGFSEMADGPKVVEFVTEEGQTNQTMLFARLNKIKPAPEPSLGVVTLMLGAISAGVLASRKRHGNDAN